MYPHDQRNDLGVRINCTRTSYRREEIKATLCQSMQTTKIRYTGERSSQVSRKTQWRTNE